MSDPEQLGPKPSASSMGPDERDRQGPNLTLLYSLITLALMAALAIAATIVLPFYRTR